MKPSKGEQVFTAIDALFTNDIQHKYYNIANGNELSDAIKAFYEAWPIMKRIDVDKEIRQVIRGVQVYCDIKQKLPLLEEAKKYFV